MSNILNLNIALNEEEQYEREHYNLVPTLNGMGYMYERHSPYVNEYLKAYIESLPHLKDPVLDIGVAYGVTVLDSLACGATIIANEICQPQLDILMQHIPDGSKGNVTFNLARFPQETNFADNSFGAVLISRVLNFLKGDEIDAGLKKIYTWLKPGGKVYIIAESVYKELFKDLIPIVKKRIEQGERWPGELDDIRRHLKKRQNHLPDSLNLLDDTTMKRALTDAEFKIEKCTMFSKSNVPKDAIFDGKETVGIIGVKPE